MNLNGKKQQQTTNLQHKHTNTAFKTHTYTHESGEEMDVKNKKK